MSYISTSTLKNSTIMYLFSEKDRIDLAPDYQRSGGVWTRQKKQLLIDSILNDYDIPKIYFHTLSAPGSPRQQYDYAVIDGRQRIETIWAFMEDKFCLSDDFEYQIDESVNLSGLSYKDLAESYPKIRIKFDSFVLPIVSVETDDIDLIEDMFSRLNEAVPLNAAEKRNAIGGNVVAAIREVSEHRFFKTSVVFGNKRAQHKEVTARFLLTEYNLAEHERVIDTKREYLDGFTREYRDDDAATIAKTKGEVEAVLNLMADKFTESDPLLRAQGNMVIYYMIFRGARENNEVNSFTRENIVRFRDRLKENRELAETDFVKADFELLEYDRLSQQGTNDASNIRERYEVLAKFLGLTVAY